MSEEKTIKGDVEAGDQHYIMVENEAHDLGEAVIGVLDKMGIHPNDHPRLYIAMVESHIEIGKIRGTVELVR